MFDQKKAFDDAQRLYSTGRKRISKYLRSMNRYFYNGFRRDSLWTQDSYPMGYWTSDNPDQLMSDLGPLPTLNIIRSCIDTSVSKLSQTKPLPNFTPVKGTWRTRKVCRGAQIYFDDFFTSQKAYTKGIAVARDAMTFEYGVLWVDDETKSILRIAPWEFDYDPAEYNFGQIKRCSIHRQQYPLQFLRDKIESYPDLVALLENDPGAKVEYILYYNMNEKKQYKFIGSQCIEERDLDYEIAPFRLLWYRAPVKGWASTSMSDSLMPLQEQIDRISRTIHEALELNPANAIFVPRPAGDDFADTIKPSELTNQIGAVYGYTYVPGMVGSGVTVSTPAPLDPMYLQLLEFYLNQGYNMEGISQLSAQSKKPAGINSGVGLQTLEDVESERFNAWLQDYIHMYVDIADLCIRVFPKDDDVLPNRVGRSSIKWGDIVQERDLFNIQRTPVSNLSRDPQTKMEQVQQLLQMGLIKPTMAASLLEFADLDGAYSILNASYDDCQKIIERAVEKANFEFYEGVDINQLFSEAINTLLMLDADDEDPKILQNLIDFIGDLKKKMDMIRAASMPPPIPVPPIPAVNPAPIPPAAPPVPPAPMAQ